MDREWDPHEAWLVNQEQRGLRLLRGQERLLVMRTPAGATLAIEAAVLEPLNESELGGRRCRTPRRGCLLRRECGAQPSFGRYSVGCPPL
jgi:hypothetical protein